MRTLPLLFAFLSFGFATQSFGTSQVGERLIYEGETMWMRSTPLDQYLTRTEQNPAFEDYFRKSVTACWRGYIGNWEIKNGWLYLNQIQDFDEEVTFPLQRIFPDYQSGPIKATWFSGYLRIPEGDQLHYVHMGFQSIYEGTILIQVDSGKVVDKFVVPQAGVAFAQKLYGYFDITLPEMSFSDGESLEKAVSKVVETTKMVTKASPENSDYLDKVTVRVEINREIDNQTTDMELKNLPPSAILKVIANSAGAEHYLSHRGNEITVHFRPAHTMELPPSERDPKEVISEIYGYELLPRDTSFDQIRISDSRISLTTKWRSRGLITDVDWTVSAEDGNPDFNWVDLLEKVDEANSYIEHHQWLRDYLDADEENRIELRIYENRLARADRRHKGPIWKYLGLEEEPKVELILRSANGWFGSFLFHPDEEMAMLGSAFNRDSDARFPFERVSHNSWYNEKVEPNWVTITPDGQLRTNSESVKDQLMGKTDFFDAAER